LRNIKKKTGFTLKKNWTLPIKDSGVAVGRQTKQGWGSDTLTKGSEKVYI